MTFLDPRFDAATFEQHAFDDELPIAKTAQNKLFIEVMTEGERRYTHHEANLTVRAFNAAPSMFEHDPHTANLSPRRRKR